MTDLNDFKQIANNTAKRIIENTNADGVMLIVVKDSELLITSHQTTTGLLMLLEAQSEINKSLIKKTAEIINKGSPDCDCPHCTSKRAEQQKTVH